MADLAEPERTFHVENLPTHPFFKTKLNTKHPQAFVLPNVV